MSAKWVIWLALTGAGCSTVSGTSSRPVPLPPHTDPGDLFNVTPAGAAPLLDAQPYYVRNVADAGTPPASSDPRREPDPRREKIPSEFNVKKARAAESQRLRQENDPARREKLKEIEKKKGEAELGVRRHETADGLGELSLGLLEKLGVRRADLPSTREVEERAKRNGIELNLKATFDSEKEFNSARESVARLEKDRQAVLAETALPGAKYDILILSGGGSRSLFLYGTLCGWADSGTMPDFQVITGVSGGALAAAVLFGGREYLADLRRIFLTTEQKFLHGGFWDRKRFPHPFGVGTDSVVDTTKIREHARQVFNSGSYFEKVAAEHAKGRRLYVGTTNLDTQRFVVWDMGAIASEGTAESRKLYEDILIASSAMAPLLQPARIATAIDGKRYEEIHVDGGATRNLFFYPPSDWPGEDEDAKTDHRLLAGARVHVILGGKVYESPEGTDPKLAPVGFRMLGTLLTALQRAEVARIYSFCLDRGMTMRIAAIPEEYAPLPQPAKFDPAMSRALFCEGYSRIQNGRAWDEPAERAASEERARRGTVLTTEPTNELGSVIPLGQPRGQQRVRGR